MWSIWINEYEIGQQRRVGEMLQTNLSVDKFKERGYYVFIDLILCYISFIITFYYTYNYWHKFNFKIIYI